jgi:hypothetical protein
VNGQIKINWYRCKVERTVMSDLMRRDPAYVYVPPLPRNDGERASDAQLLAEAAQAQVGG